MALKRNNDIPPLLGFSPSLNAPKRNNKRIFFITIMHPLFVSKLKVDSLEIAIADLPPHLEGTRLVQLSDFHYDGVRLSDTLLDEAIAASNRLEPDLIFLTGDFVTRDTQPVHRLVRHLKHLETRAGIYAVLGNHDNHYPHSISEITAALTQIGIRVLCNEIVYPLGSELAIVGFPDLFSKKFYPESVMKSIPETLPRIVLSHNPDTAALLQPWRVDLQLSGHTHGGQIVLPLIGALPGFLQKIRRKLHRRLRWLIPFRSGCLKIFKHWEWASGLHPVGDNTLYVNRGLGTYFPGRLNCPPELTFITLTRK